ncbi:hypothetical protein V5F41_16950 [Xanthobacter autotrophicus]|uniref:hypothetical protein n=1 Tax=Xanthobacter autotrophicus TaxID=280 RepID=UPI003729244F
MEVLLALGLLGWGVYRFFKLNTDIGTETLRAYVYLELLLKNAPPQKAQELAGRDMSELNSAFIKHVQHEVRYVHGGKHWALIAEAYRHGMVSKLPRWHSDLILKKGTSYSVEIAYTMHLIAKEGRRNAPPKEPSCEWTRPFLLYYLINESHPFCVGPNEIAENILALLHGQITQELQLSLSASLRYYLAFAYPHVERYDIRPVIEDAHAFLRDTIRTLNTPSEQRSFIQKMAVLDMGSPMSPDELESVLEKLQTHSPGRRETAATMLTNMMFQSFIAEQFQEVHGKTYTDFLGEIVVFWKERQLYN